MSKVKYDKMTSAEQEGDDFMSRNWRPMMAMSYMATCIFDFIVGPIFFNLLQYHSADQHIDMWQPLTLQGAGLYHISMGIVLGITAHGRTQEKLNGIGSNSSFSAMGDNFNSIYNYSRSNNQNTYYNPDDFRVNSSGRPQKTVASNKFGKIVPPEDDEIL